VAAKADPYLPPGWSLMELPQIIPVPLEWSAVALFISELPPEKKSPVPMFEPGRGRMRAGIYCGVRQLGGISHSHGLTQDWRWSSRRWITQR
jgi:hypothetical protein